MIDKIDSPDVETQTIEVVKKVNTKKTINTLLICSAILIFIAVIASYFVKELGGVADISWKHITSEGLWLAVACYSISTIFKQVAINRARLTDEYKTVRTVTEKKLKDYSEKGWLDCAAIYCRAYEDAALKEERERILSLVGIPYDTFLSEYLSKSIFAVYRCYRKILTIRQIFAIHKANTVKKIKYSPDFLRSTVRKRNRLSPSNAFDVERKNILNDFKYLFTSIVGGIFAITIASDIIVSFSVSALIEAGIKVAIIIMTSSFRASWGWELVMGMEINRLNLQASEADACARWGRGKVNYDREAE